MEKTQNSQTLKNIVKLQSTAEVCKIEWGFVWSKLLKNRRYRSHNFNISPLSYLQQAKTIMMTQKRQELSKKTPKFLQHTQNFSDKFQSQNLFQTKKHNFLSHPHRTIIKTSPKPFYSSQTFPFLAKSIIFASMVFFPLEAFVCVNTPMSNA
jgi:hypothetical protein